MSFIEDESKGTPIVELIKDQDLLGKINICLYVNRLCGI